MSGIEIQTQKITITPITQNFDNFQIEPKFNTPLIFYQPQNEKSQIDTKPSEDYLYKTEQLGENYNSFKTEDGNVIWAAAMNLAFDDLKTNFLQKEPLLFKNQSTSREALLSLKILNNSIFKKNDINQNSIYIKSGNGNQTIDTINREVLQKFPHKSQNPLDITLSDDAFLSYAYLFKALKYRHEFERIPGMLWFGKSNSKQVKNNYYLVEAFSAVSTECLEQIKIIKNDGPHEFFIGLKAKQQSQQEKNQRIKQTKIQQQKGFFTKIIQFFQSLWHNFWNEKQYILSPDVIYIISTQSQLTVDNVIEKVRQAQKKNIDQRPSNPNLVQFIMPVIDLDLKHQYFEFQGLQIQNSNLRNNKIKMVQNIKLRMDQKGVIVQNDAFIAKDECAVIGNFQIRVNKPFWLILTEESKHPYLVIKINYLPEKILKDD